MPKPKLITLDRLDAATRPASSAKVLAQAHIDICDGVQDDVNKVPVLREIAKLILDLEGGS